MATNKEFEFLLFDRITKIQSVMRQYGEENFYLSFSGGKDSTVLSYLLDMALPDNKIPRVYINTGIEYRLVRDFVKEIAERDDRFHMIAPQKNIKKTLEEEGYPFKSKEHSEYLDIYQRNGKTKTYERYMNPSEERKTFGCPESLKYQFSDDFKLKVSDKCCFRMKEEPLRNWAKENEKPYTIIGIMRDEGGRRNRAGCLAFSGKKLTAFQPLAVVTKDWEDWLIERYDIQLSPIYHEPYNFERTGCKGCPFAINLQEQLDILDTYFPTERKQCEIIWKPVYDEYRRIGYRLQKDEFRQASIFDFVPFQGIAN